MAKPTDEQIILPKFNVSFVKKETDEFVVHEESLAQFFANVHTQNKGLILYFYPKDNTAGCSTQGQDFTQMQQNFLDLGYQIVGVSRDSVDSHKRFIDKKELTLALISDESEELCKHFDVIKEKNMYGKITLGLVRSCFVFDNTGTLTYAQRNLRAKGYAERLLATLS